MNSDFQQFPAMALFSSRSATVTEPGAHCIIISAIAEKQLWKADEGLNRARILNIFSITGNCNFRLHYITGWSLKAFWLSTITQDVSMKERPIDNIL